MRCQASSAEDDAQAIVVKPDRVPELISSYSLKSLDRWDSQ